jgi:hypothetical protein
MAKLKRKKTYINTIRYEKGVRITNTKEIQRIITEYFENSHPSKLENLNEKEKFLDAKGNYPIVLPT